MSEKSLGAMLEFLDWTAEKGLMAKNTVSGRKAAVSNVLGILDPEEQSDVTAVDLDSVMARFVNLHGKKYNTSSLNVYKSRTNAAINDFTAYLADPLAFKPQSSKSEKPAGKAIRKKTPSPLASEDLGQLPVPTATVTSVNVFPIQIRENLIVRIHGLPFDLTEAEAERIANVVKAMAMK